MIQYAAILVVCLSPDLVICADQAPVIYNDPDRCRVELPFLIQRKEQFFSNYDVEVMGKCKIWLNDGR